MTQALRVGIIGCGNISSAYIELSRQFKSIDLVACADLNFDTALGQANKYGLTALSIEELLGSPGIDIVVNLTIPDAHYQVSSRVLDAGKHVFSEKPFVINFDDGKALLALAQSKSLRVGSAPDTFLGGSHQKARELVDAGAIDQITGGTAAFMSAGMEMWHPNPDFFFKPGGGPVLDMGPYYVSNLVQLIGPVKRVVGFASTPRDKRLITSQPLNGEFVEVETPTSIRSLLEFHNGATVTFAASWDVKNHGLAPMELYGEAGSMYVPDPNLFGGSVVVKGNDGESIHDAGEHPFSQPNWLGGDGRQVANYRTAGLADMADAILNNRPARCDPSMALHVIEVLTSINASGQSGDIMTLTTSCDRPLALSPQDARNLLR